MVLDLETSLELNFMQFRIEPTNRRSISRDFEFFEITPLQNDPKHVQNSIFDDFENFGFCQKFGFWVFLEVTGHSGILEISIFLIFSRFQNFDFFDFLGGLKILAEGCGAVLVGVSMM